MKTILLTFFILSFQTNTVAQENQIKDYILKCNAYYNQGQYKKALVEINKAKNKYNHKYSNPKADTSMAFLLVVSAKVISALGDYKKALELNYEALDIFNKTGNKFWPQILMNNIAIQHLLKGDFDISIHIGEKIISTKDSSEMTMFYKFFAGSTMTNAYFNLNDFKKALYYTNLCIKYFDMLNPEVQESFSLNYLDIINNKALIYYNLDSLEISEKLFLRVKNNYSNLKNIDPNRIITNLNNLLLIYFDTNDLEKTRTIINEISAFCKINNEYLTNDSKLKTLNSIGYYYYEIENNYEYSIRFYNDAIRIINSNSKDLSALRSLIGLHLNSFLAHTHQNDLKKAKKAIKKSLYCIREIKTDHLTNLTEHEIATNLETYDYISSIYYSFILNHFVDNIEEHLQCFNQAIYLSNATLLNSTSMRMVLLRSEEIVIVKEYEIFRELKRQLNHVENLSNEELIKEGIYLNSLKDSINYKERELARKAESLKSDKQKMQLRAEDIAQILNPEEAYVQFDYFDYYNGKSWTDSVIYVAYILRKDQKSPEMIYLFEQAALETLLPAPEARSMMNNLYQQYDSTLYNLVWKPIAGYLKDAKTVYLAPSGLLHKIAFSAISMADGQTLSDKYELHQVLSGHNVVFKENPAVFSGNKSTSVALLGGINYEFVPESKDSVHFSPLSLLPENFDRGSSFGYLPGTETEVIGIEQLLHTNKSNITLLKGNNATEEQFKALQGNGAPKLLHIATHGFFAPDPQRDLKKENRGMLMSGKENRYTVADNPLYRSGLLLTGGNSSWTRKANLPADQDGILTAFEVANMDLSNTQLVVLSACETALGDIKGREGVFGLQRGFRLAGAKYLFLSLWRIPDKETAQYMSLFYGELLKSNNIVEAYHTAQKQMKNLYPNEPLKWAGMVLVE